MKNLFTSNKKWSIFLVVAVIFLIAGNIEILSAQKITEQPSDVEFCLPDTRESVSFTVVASPVISYQWQVYDKMYGWMDLTDQKGVISGANTATLTVYKPGTGWSTSNSKTFHVNVTYLRTTITSSEASLIINSPATITAQPVDDTIWIGETTTFASSSSGKPTPAKQWEKFFIKTGWTSIKDATSSTYTTGSAGTYRIEVSNTCATEYSVPAILMVMGITSHPSNVTICSGYDSDVSFTVGASGADAYQWYYWVPDKFYKFGGYWQSIKDATSSTYTVSPPVGGFTTKYNNQYRCEVTFPIGVQYSNSAYLTVHAKPSVTQHPVSQSKNEGESVTFNVSASSTLTKTYQWYKDGDPIADATGSSLTLSNLQAGDAGDYKCVVSNDCGSSTSNIATLTVIKLEWPQGWFSQRFNADPPNSKYMYDVSAVNEDIAWVAVPEEKDSLIYTENGGETWNWTHTGVTDNSEWNCIFFTDANNGWVGGDDVIAYTNNGGGDWYQWYDAGADIFRDIYFIHSSVGWAVGMSGIIYKTEDGGVNWDFKKNTGTDMYGVYFADENNGIAVGDAGIIYYTTDGGEIWTVSTDTDIPVSKLNSVYMVNKDTAYAITESEFIISINGGINWDVVASRGGNGMDFISNSEGWICASSGKIYYTNNGGEDWYEQQTPATQLLYAISMVDSDNGWAVGDDGAMLRTALGGCRLPRVSLYEDKELCASLEYLLRADTFYVAYPGYLWSTGSDNGSINVNTTGKYYVDVWNICGDKASDTINVKFFDLPEADAGRDTSLCYGDTIQLGATGGVMYSWNHAEYLSDPGIPNPLAGAPLGNTDFIVTVTDTNGCINKDTVLLKVYQVPTSTFTIPESVCEGLEGMVSYTGNATAGANYAWYFDEGNIDPLGDESYNVSWDITGERTVKLAVEENGCYSDTTRMTVTVNPIPVSGFTLQQSVCGADTIGIVYGGVGYADADYEWDFDGGATISGENEGPYQISWATEGTKTVSLQVTRYGCVSDLTQKDIVVAYPYEGEEICLVSVDEETGKNMVIWEKTPDAGIAAYNVYRETNVKNVYELLATIPYDSLSVFVDMTSKPKNKAHLYKISVVDTCGNESQKSLYHKTLFLQYGGSVEGVIMNWGEYEIEGEGNEIDFESYIIYRGSDSTKLQPIDTVSASLDQYTDTDPDALAGRRYYRIAGVKSEACDPANLLSKKAGTGPYSHSLSNLEDNRLQGSGVNDLLDSEYQLRVYPNPFSQKTKITYDLKEMSEVKIEVFNLLGARVSTIVNQSQAPGDYTYDLTATDIGSTEGIYYMRFTANGQSVIRKLILSR
jgi:photosystem II stability/assembly factor-like uncharacterized protein